MKKRFFLFGLILILAFIIPIEVNAATGFRHYEDESGNIFLGGNYIEIGINKNGTFGTTNAPKEEWGFHFISGKESRGYYLGLLSDGDGWDTGEEPTTGDFFTPGSPEERYIFSYKLDGTTYENIVANNGKDYATLWKEAPKVTDLSSGKTLKVSVVGTTKENVKLILTYTFDTNDFEYNTNVKIENNSGKEITDVRFVRSFDPDQDQWTYGLYKTYNKVTSNATDEIDGGAENFAMVVARGCESMSGVFFLSFDNRARASRGVSLSPSSAYLDRLWDSAPITEKTFTEIIDVEFDKDTNINGYVCEDKYIAITTNFGVIANGKTDSTDYITSLDPNVENSLTKLAKVTSETDINKITINANDDQYYALFEGEKVIADWTYDSDLDGKIIFDNLQANKKYTIKTIAKKDFDESEKKPKESVKIETSEVKTMINPLEPEKGSTVEPIISKSSTDITIENLNNSNVYKLEDEDGTEITGYKKPEDGKITFKDLKRGTKYYLIAKTEDEEVSGRFEIATKDEAGKYNLKGNSKNFAETIIKSSAEELKSAIILTDEEKEKIEDGHDIDIWLKVEEITEKVSDEDKKIVAEVLSDNKIAIYLDMLMFGKIGNEETKNIKELDSEIKISFNVPEEYINTDKKVKRIYKIIRVHDEESECLDTEFDEKTNTIAFKTDKFSTYALVYTDEQIEENSKNEDNDKSVLETPKIEESIQENPKTGDNVIIYLVGLVISAIGIAIIKNKNN